MKGKGGGKQHSLIPFVGSNLEVERDGTSEKDALQ